MTTGKEHTNNLIKETSPYLLQHSHNPVNWYPWGDEALSKAISENKLLLISIGYSACHWCHVMEKESFMDKHVADLMNDNFVCIKVDREERPDIDQIYMAAVQIITRRGGWPLNCFALPDGSPVFGGTYFPKSQWTDILKNISELYNYDPEKIKTAARDLKKGIATSEIILNKQPKKDFNADNISGIIKDWKNSFDNTNGGITGAPKFPLPDNLNFLLEYYYYSGDNAILTFVQLTLDKMSDGGIYDHLDGGFARYSVDDHWHVPHFEKMLYDNAQLVSVYSKAYQLTKNKRYRHVVEETLGFIERRMTSPEGGFYSSLDADSEGEEGKYYIWNKEEIEKILGEKAPLFCDYYSISSSGNYEGKNILYRTEDTENIAKKYNLTINELEKNIVDSKSTVLKERNKRVIPGTDDKILTSWNALMIRGYVDAYRALGKKQYLDSAIKGITFLLDKVTKQDGRLNRNYKNGKSTINAFLDDYSFCVEALISLYQVTLDIKWLQQSDMFLQYVIDHFFDKQSGMFFYASNLDPGLAARKMELLDNVIPASNSSMAKNLFLAGKLFSREEYINMSKQMITNIHDHIAKNTSYFSNWAILYQWVVHDVYEVVITGEDVLSRIREICRYYLPNIIIAGSTGEENPEILKNRFIKGETNIYVCRNKVCDLPVKSTDEMLKLIGLKKT